MESFAGGGVIRNDVVAEFPDNLTPFSDVSDVLFGGRILQIGAPEAELRPIHTLQKLRPIRCLDRTPTDHAGHVGDLDGPLLSYEGVVPSPEVGFHRLSAHGRSLISGRIEDCAGVARKSNVEGSCVAVGGDGCSVMGRQMKSEMNADCSNIISQARILEAELSSSSNDESESSEAYKINLRQKRRRTRKKLELFLENVTRKIMQKQEQMHRQLMEIIERKEHERLIREEAWRQQELERAKREEEIRAQETSRSLALISYIENILGQEFNIPKTYEAVGLERDEGEIHNQEVFKCDPCNRRWPKSEIQALIALRSALDQKFYKSTKGSVWEEVAAGLSNMGYSRTPKKCKEKWENINKYYKRALESGRKRPDNGTSCPYFHELDTLYRSGTLSSGFGLPVDTKRRDNEGVSDNE